MSTASPILDISHPSPSGIHLPPTPVLHCEAEYETDRFDLLREMGTSIMAVFRRPA